MDWLGSSVWWFACLIIALGCWLQTAMGFGMAVLAAPLLVIAEPEWVPIVISFVAFALSAANLGHLRQHCDWRLMAWPMITRIPGTLLGLGLLGVLSLGGFQLLVAICVLAAVLVSLSSRRWEASPSVMGLAGFVSGVIGTATSIGGPPMALVMQHGDPKQIRANLALYFLYSCFLSLFGYWLLGWFTWELFQVGISLLPACLLGFYAGKHTQRYVDAGRFRPLLLGMCSLAGVIALWGALREMAL